METDDHCPDFVAMLEPEEEEMSTMEPIVLGNPLSVVLSDAADLPFVPPRVSLFDYDEEENKTKSKVVAEIVKVDCKKKQEQVHEAASAKEEEKKTTSAPIVEDNKPIFRPPPVVVAGQDDKRPFKAGEKKALCQLIVGDKKARRGIDFKDAAAYLKKLEDRNLKSAMQRKQAEESQIEQTKELIKAAAAASGEEEEEEVQRHHPLCGRKRLPLPLPVPYDNFDYDISGSEGGEEEQTKKKKKGDGCEDKIFKVRRVVAKAKKGLECAIEELEDIMKSLDREQKKKKKKRV